MEALQEHVATLSQVVKLTGEASSMEVVREFVIALKYNVAEGSNLGRTPKTK